LVVLRRPGLLVKR